MIILAVDVGIQVCGYAVCAINSAQVNLIKQGEIKPEPKNSMPQKLNFIIDGLTAAVNEHKPCVVVVETLYSHHRHPATLGVLAQVKGAIAVFTQKWSVDYVEYSSTRARKGFIGKGNVDSSRVKKMAEGISGQTFKSVHTADAFSLAFAFAHEYRFRKIIEQAKHDFTHSR